jgi:hypothetical protein
MDLQALGRILAGAGIALVATILLNVWLGRRR